MLKEKIHYDDRLPIKVSIVNVEEYPIHFHDDLEIVFVLNGSITLKNGYYDYEMKTGDIFILNDREIHSFRKTTESNVILMFQLDMEYFIRHYPHLNNSFFVTDVNDPDDSDLEAMRELLASAVMQAHSGKLGYEQKLVEIAHNILSCLMENFQYFAIEDGRFVNETKKKSNKILASRMNRISDYLYENYSRRLTLQEIAASEHLSLYHLSHVIKQSTGLSFQQLLGFIRVEESEKLLLGTDMSINAISESVGFSATRYYTEHFKKWFGLEPEAYRDKYMGQVSSRKTLAVMKQVNKYEAGELIKRRYPDVYYDHHRKDKEPNQVFDINMSDKYEGGVDETSLGRMMRLPEFKHAAWLFNMLKGLNEKVIKSEPNCIVTTDEGSSCLSILIYNMKNGVDGDEIDVLIRVNGLYGTYNLKRVTLTGNNIEALRILSEHSNEPGSERTDVFMKLASMPAIEDSEVTAVNTLNIVSSLCGLSGELFLLDRVEN